MTVLAEMRQRAFDEFDQMVDERELEFRAALAFDDHSREDAERIISRWREGMASVRERIGGNVAITLMRFAIPLDAEMPE